MGLSLSLSQVLNRTSVSSVRSHSVVAHTCWNISARTRIITATAVPPVTKASPGRNTTEITSVRWQEPRRRRGARTTPRVQKHTHVNHRSCLDLLRPLVFSVLRNGRRISCGGAWWTRRERRGGRWSDGWRRETDERGGRSRAGFNAGGGRSRRYAVWTHVLSDGGRMMGEKRTDDKKILNRTQGLVYESLVGGASSPSGTNRNLWCHLDGAVSDVFCLCQKLECSFIL